MQLISNKGELELGEEVRFPVRSNKQASSAQPVARRATGRRADLLASQLKLFQRSSSAQNNSPGWAAISIGASFDHNESVVTLVATLVAASQSRVLVHLDLQTDLQIYNCGDLDDLNV